MRVSGRERVSRDAVPWARRALGKSRGSSGGGGVYESRFHSNSPNVHYFIISSSRRFSDVKVKDLMRNITALTEELRSLHISDGTVNSILEANISRSQVQCGCSGPRPPTPGLGPCPSPQPSHRGAGRL